MNPNDLAAWHVQAMVNRKLIDPSTESDSQADLAKLYASGLLDHYGTTRARVAFDILQALGWDIDERNKASMLQILGEIL